MGFFKSFNLARAIILFSLLSSGYLAWIDWNEYEEVTFLRTVFAHDVGKVTGEIQEQAKLHSKLIRDIKGDQFVGEASPESYIRTIYDGLNMGEVVMRTNPRRGRGYVDHQTKIDPSNPKETFDHYLIANFLYRLEAGSRQIKVTSIDMKLKPEGQRVQEGEIPADEWTFSAEVTNRVKDETSAKAGPNAVKR